MTAHEPVLVTALMALGLLAGVVLLVPGWVLVALLNVGMFALGVGMLVVGLAGGRR